LKDISNVEGIIYSNIPHKRLIVSIGIFVFVLIVNTIFLGVHLENTHKTLINQLSDVELDLSLINFHSGRISSSNYNASQQKDSPSLSNIVKSLNSLLNSNDWDDVFFPLFSKEDEAQISKLIDQITQFKDFYKTKSVKTSNSHKTFIIINLIDSTIELQNNLDDKLNNQLKIIHSAQLIVLGILFIYFIVAYRFINKYKKTKRELLLKQQEYIQHINKTHYFMKKSQNIAQIGYSIYDFDKKQWDISEDFTKFLGLKNNIVSFEEGLEMILLEDRKILTDIIEKRLHNSNAVFDVIYRIVRPKDGEIRWIHHFADTIELDADYNPLPVFGILQDITEKRKLERDYINAFIEAQEQEKQNFGEELHDGISQILAAERMYIDLLLQQENMTSKEHRKFLEKIKEHNSNAINDTRNIAHGLMSKQLKQNGLIKAIEYICDDYNHSKGITFKYKITDIKEDEIPKSVKTNIYRVCQEITTNIVRHSGADKATVSLRKTSKNKFEIVIEDNGVGIDFEKMKLENRGAGLKNVERRITLLNGRVNIKSEPDKGTKFTIIVPLATTI